MTLNFNDNILLDDIQASKLLKESDIDKTYEVKDKAD